MGRPKGSKNKKAVEKEEKEVVKAAPVVTPPPSKIVGHGVTVMETQPAPEAWTPKPDMGKIKPPPPGHTLCECLHQKETHYGPDRDWCNVGGCQCQEFKAK